MNSADLKKREGAAELGIWAALDCSAALRAASASMDANVTILLQRARVSRCNATNTYHSPTAIGRLDEEQEEGNNDKNK